MRFNVGGQSVRCEVKGIWLCRFEHVHLSSLRREWVELIGVFGHKGRSIGELAHTECFKIIKQIFPNNLYCAAELTVPFEAKQVQRFQKFCSYLQCFMNISPQNPNKHSC